MRTFIKHDKNMNHVTSDTTDKDGFNKDILQHFHHINQSSSEVYHCCREHEQCGRHHVIKHCEHGKHAINKEFAPGHNFELNKVYFHFVDECGDGTWHIETGHSIPKDLYSMCKNKDVFVVANNIMQTDSKKLLYSIDEEYRVGVARLFNYVFERNKKSLL